MDLDTEVDLTSYLMLGIYKYVILFVYRGYIFVTLIDIITL
jgi:hypothetical protein